MNFHFDNRRKIQMIFLYATVNNGMHVEKLVHVHSKLYTERLNRITSNPLKCIIELETIYTDGTTTSTEQLGSQHMVSKALTGQNYIHKWATKKN
ncbi:hypothetical protein CEXT_774161 [Caerostris extrusa]|uniref:Uncharacterized protein n=1 Tax=Caerostris extrusa TaxID=172846 RepID=A0AAV4PHN8_CAEEX|nr:hypothetical protein CEXT_774161 [Caerostris extrusa]